jgi:hypothetical protein
LLIFKGQGFEPGWNILFNHVFLFKAKSEQLSSIAIDDLLLEKAAIA